MDATHPLQQRTCEKDPTIRAKMRLTMNLVQYVCILRMALTSDTPKPSSICAHETINNCVQYMQNNSRVPFGTFGGVSPMASVGKAHSCPPAQPPETKLQIRRELLFFWSSGMRAYRKRDCGCRHCSDRGSATPCCSGRTGTDQSGGRTPYCVWTCPVSNLV